MFKVKHGTKLGTEELSVVKQSSFKERKDARLRSGLPDDNTVSSCHFPMTLGDVKATCWEA